VVVQSLKALDPFLAYGDEAVALFLETGLLQATKRLTASRDRQILEALLALYDMGARAADKLFDAFVAALADIDFVALGDESHPFEIRKNVAKLVLDFARLARMDCSRALLSPQIVDLIIEIVEATDEWWQELLAQDLTLVVTKSQGDPEFCQMLIEKCCQSDLCVAVCQDLLSAGLE
jgi:hypothetical protein